MIAVNNCNTLLKAKFDNNPKKISRFFDTINDEYISNMKANMYLNAFVPGILKTKNNNEVTNNKNSFIDYFEIMSKIDLDLSTYLGFVE